MWSRFVSEAIHALIAFVAVLVIGGLLAIPARG